jgi:hypothetical protein
MKSLKWIVSAMFTAAMISGCGSNSKKDGADLPNVKSSGMSIEYVSSTYVEGKGLVSTYRVHTADQEGNPINTPVTLSVINGVKKASINGVIHATEPITFDDPTISFAGVVPGDKLIVLPGNGNVDPVTYGDWTIQAINGVTLSLREGAYYLNDMSGLYYIIGNEKRILGRRVGVVHVESADGNTTGEDGYKYFNVVADAVLAGHTIVLGAHTDGNRLGAAIVDNVRGGCFIASDVTIPPSTGRQTVGVTLWIDPACEGVQQEYLIDVEVVPSSFEVEGNCRIIANESNFHTDEAGRVMLTVDMSGSSSSPCSSGTCPASGGGTTTSADNNATSCTIKWNGSAGAIYLEY